MFALSEAGGVISIIYLFTINILSGHINMLQNAGRYKHMMLCSHKMHPRMYFRITYVYLHQLVQEWFVFFSTITILLIFRIKNKILG